MSVTTRTNLATNPTAASLTNYAAVAGTGGAATMTNKTDGGYSGTTYNQVKWTTATTAVSGGASYTQTGLAAATSYATLIYVRSSKTQTVALQVQFRNGSNSVVNTVTGSNVALTAGAWTPVSVVGVSGAAVTNAVASVLATSGANWAVNDTLDVDAVLIEAATVVGGYFDGTFTNANSTVYAWSGTANASTSTATIYTPTITVVTKTDDPCPRGEVTIADLAPGDTTVNLWRTADNKRRAVRGARSWKVNGSDFRSDYEMPLGRDVKYELEVLAGVSAGSVVAPVTVNLASPNGYWYIQDPLVPSSAIALARNKADGKTAGIPSLTAAAVKDLEYAAAVSIIPILGSDEPVAITGQRTLAGGVDFSMFTNTAEATTQLRNLIQQTPFLLIRPPGTRNDGLPGLCYVPAAKPVEHPVTVAFGGELTKWSFQADLVAPPAVNVVIPVWTYSAVNDLWTTYQQEQTAFAGKTYLDNIKSPTGV